MSRVAFYGLDYTNRSNKLAHHLVLRQKETSGAPGGPGEVILNDSIFRSEWKAEPQIFPQQVPVNVLKKTFHKASAWGQYAGDAGWAGKLAQQTLDNPQKPSYIVFDPERHSDLRRLVEEAMQLIPPEKRWEITFNTYFTSLPAGFQCQWRFCSVGSDCIKEARRIPGTLLIDLTANLPSAGSGPLIEAARTGNPPAQPKPDKSAVQTDQPSGHTPDEQKNIQGFPGPYTPFGGNQPFRPYPGGNQSTLYYEPPKKKFPVFIIPAAVVLVVLLGAVLFFILSGPNIEPDDLTKDDISTVEPKQEKTPQKEQTEKEKKAAQTASEQKKDTPVKEKTAQTEKSKAQEKQKDQQAEKEKQEKKEIASLNLKKKELKTDFFKTPYNFDWSKPSLSQLADAVKFKEEYVKIRNWVDKAKKYKGKDKGLDSSAQKLGTLLEKQKAQFENAEKYPSNEFSELVKDGKLDLVKYKEFKKKWRPVESDLKKLLDKEIPNIKKIYEQVKEDNEAERNAELAALKRRIDGIRRELWSHNEFEFARTDKDPRKDTMEFKGILLLGERVRGVKLVSKDRRKYSEEKPIKYNVILQVKVDSEARGEITAVTYKFNDLEGNFVITRGKEDIEGINNDEPIYLGSLITNKGTEIHLQFYEGYSRFPEKKVKELNRTGPYETWNISGKSIYKTFDFQNSKKKISQNSNPTLLGKEYKDFYWEYVDPETEEIIARWNAKAAREEKTGKIVYLYKDISKHENVSNDLRKEKEKRVALDDLFEAYQKLKKERNEGNEKNFNEKMKAFEKKHKLQPHIGIIRQYKKKKTVELNRNKLRPSAELEKEIAAADAKWKNLKEKELPKKMQSAVIRLRSEKIQDVVRKKDTWILCEIPPKRAEKKEVKK